MGLERVVVDLSSDDEDPGPGKSRGRSFDWVDKLLERSVRPRLEESDDVVVVDVFSAPVLKRPRQNPEPMGLGKCGGQDVGDDDDDDCVVLDSDPEKPVAAADGKDGGRDEDEDLCIVGEKGQVACRDYPHSRHLCATYPFISSPHEKYCDLCHCYVCDSPAPCSYWGNGNVYTDHCHSNDKQQRWIQLRLSFKEKNKVATQPPQLSADSSFPTFRDSVPVYHSNPVLFRSNSLQPCLTTLSNPDATNQISQYQPSILPHRSRISGLHSAQSCPLFPGAQHAEFCLAAVTTQITNPHTRSRRTGSRHAGLIGLNNYSHNTVSHHNRIPGTVPQRSRDMSSRSPVLLVDQMQTLSSSQFTPSQTHNSASPSLTDDIYQKSWKDILASLAFDLGVSSCVNTGILDDQQPRMVSSPSVHCDVSFSETHASPDTQTLAEIPDYDGDKGSDLSTMQTSNSELLGSNTISGENCLDSLLTSVENETWEIMLK
ncbi:hypothetical protein Cni_G08888 [Canna indica]|uniref:Uncharacterized protein n=1 Tax=Canna indica TaxID=4628 RepID=A0AAQ3K1A0_9LILI|nr:hypothetical protein Cni_G08888 [Canna indica]